MSFGKKSSIFCLLVVVFVSGSFAAMEFKEADITTVKNFVERNEGSGAVPAKVNDKIREKSVVSTAAASMAELTFADSSITRMGANTQFSFQSKERLVKLEQGTILIHTPPGNGGATVDCGGVTAAVSGTTFMASHDTAGNVMFVLLEGQGGLKVTAGGSTTVIRPGQAASVGAEVKNEIANAESSGTPGGEKKSLPSGATPAASGDEKGGPGTSPAAPGGGDTGGGTPPSSATPKIQVFDVDVKKVVSTTPLIVEFKSELPSAGKIDKIVENQQNAIQEGKLEKTETEIVLIKHADGDVMVGAPKIDPTESVVVNRKTDQVGAGGMGNDNLDVETAAGPGAGAGGAPMATAPAPRVETPAPSPALNPPPVLNPGQIVNIPKPAATPPSSLNLVLGGSSGTVTLDRGVVTAQAVNFSGIQFPAFNLDSGESSKVFTFDPRAYFLGLDSGMNLVSSRSVTASVDTLSATATFTHDLSAIQNQSVNPVRALLLLPSPAELNALDAFFYFTARAPGVTDGPDRFFADLAVGGIDRTFASPGSSLQLYPAQNWDFFAARKYSALAGVHVVTPSVGKTETVLYANQIDLGEADPRWQGTVDPRTASTSLGYRYLILNSDYLPVFDKTMAGYHDSFGALLSPLVNFPVWDDAGGFISSADKLEVNLSGSANWTLVAGNGGLAARGLEVDAKDGGVAMLTSGDLNLKTTRIHDVGSGGGSGENLTLEARGKVKMGTAGNLDLDVPTNAGLPEQQQVRLEGSTDGSGNALASSLAVVRTGDSLELRNVTIRGFAETRLEKLNPTTKALEGRVLISGSAVRDFKIKELVGAAINADAKIQMMALDQNGALAGDMVVGGNDTVNRNRLPVEAKIASALKEAGETLPTQTASAMVDAKQIDLAAGNLKFQNANLVAMNAITARANTILIQNSFMTVVRNQGMINMYVQSGLVNTSYGTQMAGRVNFDGLNKFQIGSNYFEIGNQSQLTAAYGTNLIDFSQNGGTPQAGKLNVLKL